LLTRLTIRPQSQEALLQISNFSSQNLLQTERFRNKTSHEEDPARFITPYLLKRFQIGSS
jgi:hypothetical protein